MSWLIDQIPWWVYPMVLMGGAGALFAFVPGALALVVGVYRLLPPWARWVIGGAAVAVIAYVKGRNTGAENAQERQRELDDRARRRAREVRDDVSSLSEKEIDKRLEDSGGFWDDPKGGRGGGR